MRDAIRSESSDRGFGRQLKAEGCARAQGTDDIYRPVVQFQEFFGDRQSQPGATLLRLAMLIQRNKNRIRVNSPL